MEARSRVSPFHALRPLRLCASLRLISSAGHQRLPTREVVDTERCVPGFKHVIIKKQLSA